MRLVKAQEATLIQLMDLLISRFNLKVSSQYEDDDNFANGFKTHDLVIFLQRRDSDRKVLLMMETRKTFNKVSQIYYAEPFPETERDFKRLESDMERIKTKEAITEALAFGCYRGNGWQYMNHFLRG